MAVNVGTAEVEVRADLDPYVAQLQQALRMTQTFNAAANREMQGVRTATQQASVASAAFAKAQQLAGAATLGLSTAIGTVVAQARASLGILPTLAGIGGIGAMVVAAQQAVQAFGQWEQQQIAFEGQLRATRGTLGLTTQEVTSLAQAISRDTLTPMEQLRGFMLALGRTGEVTTDTLQRAARVLPDLALRMGSFSQASAALSESLRKPEEAVRLLRDAGVQFTATQRSLLEDNTLFADRMQNATEVLRALEQQIGGEAGAHASGVSGGFQNLSTSVSQLTINLGGAIDRFLGLSVGARTLGDHLRELNQALFPQSVSDRIATVRTEIQGIEESIRELTAAGEDLQRRTGGGGLGAWFRGLTQGMGDASIAALGGRLPVLRAELEVLELQRNVEREMAEAEAGQRRAEIRTQTLNDQTKALQDQLSALDGINRAQVQAFQLADRHGLARDDPQVARWQQLLQQLEERRRLLAQAGRQTLFERENERLEEQLQLFRYGNDELRVRAQLNRIVQAADRARQPLSDEQKAELEANIRALDRVKQLTSTVESAFTSLFSNMTSALAEFAVTGKFEFKKFADSVVRDMVRIATQAFITRPLLNAITGVTNPAIAGAMGVDFADSSASIPGYAGGGSFVVPGSGGGDKPALMVGLSAGERVDITPAGKVGRMGDSKGLTVINTVNSSRDFEVSQNEREGSDGSRIVEQTFNEVIRRIGRGEADNTFGARFGMRPRTTQR
jgi:hypothetical protein